MKTVAKELIDGWYKPGDKRFVWTPERLNALAENLDQWVNKNIKEKKNFLLGDWCFEVGFLPVYFARYREKCLALDEAYNKAKAWQAHNIAKGALFNKLNSRFASLWLFNHHQDDGWVVSGNSENKEHALSQQEEINKNMKAAYDLITKKV